MKAKSKFVERFKNSQISSVTVALLLLLVLVSIFNGSRFWKIGNLVTVASNASIVGILACGMTLVIILGEIDLSIAANAVYASVIMGVLYTNLGVNPLLALIVGLIVSTIFGVINGLIISKLKFNSMITTLSMQLIVRALCYSTTNAVSMEVGGDFYKLIGRTRVFGRLPIYVLYFVAVIAIFSYVLTQTAYGRRVFAIGGNESATYLSGVNVDRTKIAAYALCGLLAGVAGIANALSVSYATPQAMTGREFEVIASVVLGGVSLNGGRGSMLGTFLGVLVMAIISNVLILIGIQSYWQSFGQGVILLIAVYIDGLRTSGNK